jgi:hypothetical protein
MKKFINKEYINNRIIEKFKNKKGENYKFSLNRLTKILNNIFIGLNSATLSNSYKIDNLNKWFVILQIKKELYYSISYTNSIMFIDVSNDFLIKIDISNNNFNLLEIFNKVNIEQF